MLGHFWLLQMQKVCTCCYWINHYFIWFAYHYLIPVHRTKFQKQYWRFSSLGGTFRTWVELTGNRCPFILMSGLNCQQCSLFSNVVYVSWTLVLTEIKVICKQGVDWYGWWVKTLLLLFLPFSPLHRSSNTVWQYCISKCECLQQNIKIRELLCHKRLLF